jgi:hypothetical protein
MDWVLTELDVEGVRTMCVVPPTFCRLDVDGFREDTAQRQHKNVGGQRLTHETRTTC